MSAPKPPPPKTGFDFNYAIANWNQNLGFDDCYMTVMQTPKGVSVKNKTGTHNREGPHLKEPELILMDINTLAVAKRNELIRVARFIGYLHSKLLFARYQVRDIKPGDFLTATTEGPLFDEINRLGLAGELNRYVKSPMMTFQEIDLDQKKKLPPVKKAVTATIGHPMPLRLPPPQTLKSKLALPKLDTIHDVREYVNGAYEKAREVVIGQDTAIKLLLIRFVSYIRNKDMVAPILVCGPTGCGKTHALRVLSELNGMPFARIVVPDLTPAGIKGMNIQDAFASEIMAVRSRHGGNPERLVLQVDEFDKIVRKGDDDLGFSAMVLNEFLKLLEPGAALVVNGKNSEETIPLDALVILSGAFSFIDYDHTSGVDEHVLKEAGFIDELNGRIGATIPLRKLDKEDFLRMLSQDKPVPQIAQQIAELSSLGIDVRLHEETVDLIAQMAVDSGMGARHISKTVREAFDRLTERILFADIRSDAKENRGLELEDDLASKRLKVMIKPQFIHKKPKKEKRKVGFDNSGSG